MASETIATLNMELVPRTSVANRVLCCGEGSRARKIADMFLDKDAERFELVSHREFVIITGRFEGVSMPMLDSFALCFGCTLH